MIYINEQDAEVTDFLLIMVGSELIMTVITKVEVMYI